jgi:DNA excision repair protein ERCC-4
MMLPAEGRLNARATRDGCGAHLPAELSPENITAVVDTREQHPLDLSPLRMTIESLVTGDYSVKGLENLVTIERKSFADLLSCVGVQRERFDREIQRLLAYPVRAIVVEATWAEVEEGKIWRSKVTPAAAIGSLLGWIAAGVPVIMAGSRDRAARYVSRMLFIAASRRYREGRRLMANIAAGSIPVPIGNEYARDLFGLADAADGEVSP